VILDNRALLERSGKPFKYTLARIYILQLMLCCT
jgi:hypothetical protein